MISYLEGIVKKKTDSYVIVMISDIGYQVFMPAKMLVNLKEGEKASIFVHDHLRENAHDLFGFSTHAELEFFWRLLDISGVGPRMAMNIIALGSIEDLVKNIEKGNIDYIFQVSGVGKKTAQKIVIELKGKLDLSGADEEEQEVILALKNLGYTASQAREAVRKVSKEITETGDKVREALRYLSK